MEGCPVCKGLIGSNYGYRYINKPCFITKEYVKHSFLFGFIKVYATFEEKSIDRKEIKCCVDCATHNYKDYKAYVSYVNKNYIKSKVVNEDDVVEALKAHDIRNNINSLLQKMSPENEESWN